MFIWKEISWNSATGKEKDSNRTMLSFGSRCLWWRTICRKICLFGKMTVRHQADSAVFPGKKRKRLIYKVETISMSVLPGEHVTAAHLQDVSSFSCVVAFWQLFMLVWCGIFQLFSVTDISEKTKCTQYISDSILQICGSQGIHTFGVYSSELLWFVESNATVDAKRNIKTWNILCIFATNKPVEHCLKCMKPNFIRSLCSVPYLLFSPPLHLKLLCFFRWVLHWEA